ncbi:MAG: translation elongation factor Ts [Desulfobacterales bacterium]|nr:translation elongation factor Ts [Desulfobacterales bacterium]
MAAITTEIIKELRVKTGAGIMDCKEALAESKGDIEQSIVYLRKKGLATAEKRAGKATSEGCIQSYIHLGGKIGAMVEVNCETDFVAKTEDMATFVKNLAMHVVAANPVGVSSEDISEEMVNKERDIYRVQAAETGKPANVIEKIIDGKIKKFYKDNCLLEQQYVKDPNITISDLINDMITKTGEKITIKRFARFQIGEK